MRLLGLDYGLKRIGYAFCDTETALAIPGGVIDASHQPLEEIGKIIREDGIDAIVVGIPSPTHHAQGQKQRKKTEAFIESLRGVVSLPIYEANEENTSLEARRLIKEEGSEAPVDALAAMLILQEYLSAK